MGAVQRLGDEARYQGGSNGQRYSLAARRRSQQCALEFQGPS
jgi:hypothetical protein